MPHAALLQANALNIPLASDSVQMVITSPPYYNAREEYAAWPTYQDYLNDMARVWAECYRVLCDGGRIAVNVPLGYGRTSIPYTLVGLHTTESLLHAGFECRAHIIWDKGTGGANIGTAWGSWLSANNPSLRDGYEIIIVAHKGSPSRVEKGTNTITRDDFLEATRSVWSVSPIQSWHPAPFPPEIPRRLIELYTYLGDIVLDPFSGSGTTVQVARHLGRRGIGLDLRMDYLRRSLEPIALEEHDWNLVRRLKAAKATDLAGLPMFGD